jgi:hypothetical protein
LLTDEVSGSALPINTLAFWNREQVGTDIARGVEEMSLALVADGWSRTYRSRAVTYAAGAGAVETRSGLRIVPDRVAAMGKPVDFMLPAVGERPAAFERCARAHSGPLSAALHARMMPADQRQGF